MLSSEVGTVDFPTLGDLWSAWIEQHCRIPDRIERGKPFREYDWQFWITANEGRIRPDATFEPAAPPLNQAFVYRRMQTIAPQKIGKGPWTAAHICLEAVGPSEFAGWAIEGDEYHCEDNGCGCGWVYRYLPGEPMGMRHPSPLIQVAATSEEQVANIWRPLVGMIGLGPLKSLLLPRGEFVRIVGTSGDKDMDRIDRVTASAKSRLGAPISRAFFDETGLFTEENGLLEVAETMRRGAAGMGGRTSETTNMYDPSEQSYAQRTMESAADDVFRFWRNPDAVLKKPDGSKLSFRNKAERRKILAFAYDGTAHVNLDSIDAEAAELADTDVAQAERFFGNRNVPGLGAWCEVEKWRDRARPQEVKPRTQIVLGFDGSDVDDWTGIRAETRDGYQFTPVTSAGATIWNPAAHGGKVPRLAVAAAVEELFATYDVIRMYCDPPFWETEVDAWAEQFGEKRVIRWSTYSAPRMHAALERIITDVHKADSGFTHDGCEFTALHVGNARKVARKGGVGRYGLAKPDNARKIDLAVCSTLAHEAWGDATAAKLWKRKNYVYMA